ncbi:hypothetical protein X773_13065 [Mesorhizobium sp. LSJC285A00]|nr:hypothetical protein X773_13065 [Mesorhizobium sp. LSJC285A00]
MDEQFETSGRILLSLGTKAGISISAIIRRLQAASYLAPGGEPFSKVVVGEIWVGLDT